MAEQSKMAIGLPRELLRHTVTQLRRQGHSPANILSMIGKVYHYSVEALWAEHTGRTYWKTVTEPVAEYVNTGDAYGMTVLWDRTSDRLLITSWGNWVETKERRGWRFP